MEGNELDQVREDIDTIKSAVGMELPFGWVDVWLCCGCVFAGGFVFLMSVLQGEFGIFWGVPAIIPFVLATIVLRIKYRKSTGRSATRRREYSLSIIIPIVVVVLLILFLEWGLSQGMAIEHIAGIMYFMIGLMTLVVAIINYARLSAIGISISFMAIGLTYPIYAEKWPLGVFVGMATFIGCSISALIMTLQLRRQARLNGTV